MGKLHSKLSFGGFYPGFYGRKFYLNSMCLLSRKKHPFLFVKTDDIPSFITILNMLIPFLQNFLECIHLASKVSFISNIKPLFLGMLMVKLDL